MIQKQVEVGIQSALLKHIYLCTSNSVVFYFPNLPISRRRRFHAGVLQCLKGTFCQMVVLIDWWFFKSSEVDAALSLLNYIFNISIYLIFLIISHKFDWLAL